MRRGGSYERAKEIEMEIERERERETNRWREREERSKASRLRVDEWRPSSFPCNPSAHRP